MTTLDAVIVGAGQAGLGVSYFLQRNGRKHTRLANDIVQLHTADYHSAAALPPGAIVVVGNGQSGCQISVGYTYRSSALRAGRFINEEFRRCVVCTSSDFLGSVVANRASFMELMRMPITSLIQFQNN